MGMSPSWIEPNAMSVTWAIDVISSARLRREWRLLAAARSFRLARRMMLSTRVSARITSKM